MDLAVGAWTRGGAGSGRSMDQHDEGAQSVHRGSSALVLAPSPLVTVTLERGSEDAEIHLHAGGQGFWLARMLSVLEIEVVLCGSFGGETGVVARSLIADGGIRVRDVPATGSNGAYVHDRRDGERQLVGEMAPSTLTRHDLDDLYGAALVEGLDADVCVLGGPPAPDVMPAETYERLATDLRDNGRLVVVDLSSELLDAALAGGVHVAKVSHEELLADGRAPDDSETSLIQAIERMAEGARHVVVTRAEKPALALLDGELVEVAGPRLEPRDHRGAGDSLTAGVAAGLARGDDIREALCLGSAAGSINVTRRGLASGTRDEIERLATHVEVRHLAQR